MQIDDLEDIHHWCAKIGLFPIRVQEKSIKNIIEYVHEIGVDLTKKAVIPLAHDYGCD